MTDAELVAAFRETFPSNSKWWCWLDITRLPEREVGKKTEVPDREHDIHGVDGPVTDEAILKHLRGEWLLGLAPIGDDGMTDWGGLDLDNYSVTMAQVQDAVSRVRHGILEDTTGRPRSFMVPHETKSAARVLVFTTERVPVTTMQAAIRSLGSRLPAKVADPHEVFPKQGELTERPTVVWLPYCGDRFVATHPTSKVGRTIDLEAFFTLVRESRITLEELETLSPRQVGAVGEADDSVRARAKMRRLLKELEDTPQGGRNDKLFTVSAIIGSMVNSGYVEHDEAEDAVTQVAAKWPNLEEHSLPTIRRGLGDGEKAPYEEFGDGYPRVQRVTVTETDEGKRWTFHLEQGVMPDLTAKQLNDNRLFNVAATEALGLVFLPMKPMEWSRLIAAAMASAERVEVAPDLRPGTEVLDLLRKFTATERKVGRPNVGAGSIIENGQPWFDEEHNVWRFKLAGFVQYIRLRHKVEMGPIVLARQLKLVGAKDGKWDAITIRGNRAGVEREERKAVWAWSVPASVIEDDIVLPVPAIRGSAI